MSHTQNARTLKIHVHVRCQAIDRLAHCSQIAAADMPTCDETFVHTIRTLKQEFECSHFELFADTTSEEYSF